MHEVFEIEVENVENVQVDYEVVERRWLGLRPFQQHSHVLVVAGFTYVAIGCSYVFTEPPPSRRQALTVATDWWDLHYWGYVFIFVGVLAFVSSRWPPISRSWGYVALTSLSAGWAAFYLMGIIVHHTPLTNISSVLMWGLIAYLWRGISGLRNPGDV